MFYDKSPGGVFPENPTPNLAPRGGNFFGYGVSGQRPRNTAGGIFPSLFMSMLIITKLLPELVEGTRGFDKFSPRGP